MKKYYFRRVVMFVAAILANVSLAQDEQNYTDMDETINGLADQEVLLEKMVNQLKLYDILAENPDVAKVLLKRVTETDQTKVLLDLLEQAAKKRVDAEPKPDGQPKKPKQKSLSSFGEPQVILAQVASKHRPTKIILVVDGLPKQMSEGGSYTTKDGRVLYTLRQVRHHEDESKYVAVLTDWNNQQINLDYVYK